MATRPATAPVMVPSIVGLPIIIQSSRAHVKPAIVAAVLVTTKAFTARPFAASALPELNPNHPNQSKAAPKTDSGRLWGGGVLARPFLFPRYKAVTMAAMPAFMWTTVPPAKSRAPNFLTNPPTPHTQWQTGSYTNVAQASRKIIKDENFILSAKAPMISAGVIIANIAWNIIKAWWGIVAE